MSSESTPLAVLEVSPAARVEDAPSYAGDPDATVAYGQPCYIPVREFPFRVGRGEGNHVLVQDGGMSRKSIGIAHDNGKFELHDLGQRMGVFVNGTKVEGSRVLEFDDVITFPNADLKIRFTRPAVPQHPPGESPEPPSE